VRGRDVYPVVILLVIEVSLHKFARNNRV
jgi:hypothetical protein